jgi:hypothetical protein
MPKPQEDYSTTRGASFHQLMTFAPLHIFTFRGAEWAHLFPLKVQPTAEKLCSRGKSKGIEKRRRGFS